ncbi:PLP-dependent aminotransferase family protein [Acidisphaera sp. S103]|uniref:MocR-like pyridoxine biosynthesis transcription factor PdxR n=1 Tax=Acidisphaera sp. S103 TaxID=1747223 RepID=UPI00131CF617|nr:PLP-dependent aminotransferase family protein [Acidisphaera sp. S103]
MTLSITLDTTEEDPLFLQIATRVRSAITAGHLLPGARLPSSRALAAQLAIARGTVDAAYALLAGEGAIETRRSAGTIVSGQIGRRIEVAEQSPLEFPSAPAAVCAEPLPFQMGLPALDAFPRKLWSNLTVRAARSMQPADLADVDPAGLPDLRQAVAAYLGVARGIKCKPDQVLITAGYQGAFALVRTVLIRPGDPVWMEDPGYHMTRMALETAGARVVPVRVDAEGLRVAAGINAAPKARLAVVTPTHQCPTGVALSLPRRLELLTWAAEAGSWIVEDDYDSEFRYVGRPLPSLKSLDRGQRVLYAGSFSKVLFPALRLGYLIVPPELQTVFLRASRLLTSGLPMLEQKAVAAFMRNGHFARHIRRMRILYGERRRCLATALQAAFADRVTVELAAGGMHLLARFPGADDDSVLAKRAALAGLATTALSSLTMAHDAGQGLLLGFTNVATADADALVGRLRGALR